MRIKWIFYIILMLLAASVVTILQLPPESDPELFYIGLGTTVLAIILLVVFYASVMKPIRSITNGSDLLRAQDFSSRLAHVNQHEADKIVDMFNAMMTALKEERVALQEQNHFLDLLIAVSPMGIMILDDRDKIVTANNTAASFLGFRDAGDVCGMPLGSIDSQLGHALAAIAQGDNITIRLNDSMIYRCSRLQFMDKGFAHPFILIEKLTDDIMLAEKKSYEKVIRVISHEVNNSMAGVKSLLSVAAQIVRDNAGADADVAGIMNICEERCTALSRFITSYADVVKIPDVNISEADLNELVTKWRVMLESLCAGRNIRFELDLCPGSLPVMIDPVLFEQVLINIVKNSAESIADNDGRIRIETSRQPATITIVDNGAGISDEAADKLFSPFFSTKPNGHGIGLLFISEVLHKHKCRFALSTDPDSLTRFRISF